MGAFELEPFAAGTRARGRGGGARRPAPRWSAAATRRRRSPQFGLADRSTTSRPAAAPRSSCSRASELPGRGGARRCVGPYIAGNWKLWGTRAEAAAYCERLLALLPDAGRRAADVGVCAPFTALDVVRGQLRGSERARLRAEHAPGGRPAPTPARSRRRCSPSSASTASCSATPSAAQHFGETDRALQEKVPAALAAGLEPILCVGETEEEREAGDTERKLRHQVQEGLEKVADERLADVVIAYEPIWAIGTGKVATPEQAQEAIALRARAGGRPLAGGGRARARALRRQRQARERRRDPGPAGRGRRARGRREPRPGLLARIVAAVPTES